MRSDLQHPGWGGAYIGKEDGISRNPKHERAGLGCCVLCKEANKQHRTSGVCKTREQLYGLEFK